MFQLGMLGVLPHGSPLVPGDEGKGAEGAGAEGPAVDVFLSHDWPTGVARFGDQAKLRCLRVDVDLHFQEGPRVDRHDSLHPAQARTMPIPRAKDGEEDSVPIK